MSPGLNELPQQPSRLEKTMTTRGFLLTGDSLMRHFDPYQQALECPICFLVSGFYHDVVSSLCSPYNGSTFLLIILITHVAAANRYAQNAS